MLLKLGVIRLLMAMGMASSLNVTIGSVSGFVLSLSFLPTSMTLSIVV